MNYYHIVIIDTGINIDEGIFNEKKIDSIIFLPDTYEVVEVNDNNDEILHGTIVTGIITKELDTQPVLMVKIVEDGGISEKSLIKALNYVLDNYSVDIINISMGQEFCENYYEYDKIRKKANDSRTIIISAYSNNNTMSYPASFDWVVGVVAEQFVMNKESKCEKVNYVVDGIVRCYLNECIFEDVGNSYACARVCASISKQIRENKKKYENFYGYNQGKVQEKSVIDGKNAIFVFVDRNIEFILKNRIYFNFELMGVYDLFRTGETLTAYNSDKQIESLTNINWDIVECVVMGGVSYAEADVNKRLNKLKNKLKEKAKLKKCIIVDLDKTEDLKDYCVVDDGKLFSGEKKVISILSDSDNLLALHVELKSYMEKKHIKTFDLSNLDMSEMLNFNRIVSIKSNTDFKGLYQHINRVVENAFCMNYKLVVASLKCEEIKKRDKYNIYDSGFTGEVILRALKSLVLIVDYTGDDEYFDSIERKIISLNDYVKKIFILVDNSDKIGRLREKIKYKEIVYFVERKNLNLLYEKIIKLTLQEGI